MKRKTARTEIAILVAVVSAISAQPAVSADQRMRHLVIAPVDGKSISAGESGVLDVLLPDGTSLILGSGARVDFDGTGAGARLILRPTSQRTGVVRISGGTANDVVPIIAETPHARLSLVAGSAVVAVDTRFTRVLLLNGGSLDATADGVTRQVWRPGFAVTADARGISRPRRPAPAVLEADMRAIAPMPGRQGARTEPVPRPVAGLATGGTPAGPTGAPGVIPVWMSSRDVADEAAQSEATDEAWQPASGVDCRTVVDPVTGEAQQECIGAVIAGETDGGRTDGGTTDGGTTDGEPDFEGGLGAVGSASGFSALSDPYAEPALSISGFVNGEFTTTAQELTGPIEGPSCDAPCAGRNAGPTANAVVRSGLYELSENDTVQLGSLGRSIGPAGLSYSTTTFGAGLANRIQVIKFPFDQDDDSTWALFDTIGYFYLTPSRDNESKSLVFPATRILGDELLAAGDVTVIYEEDGKTQAPISSILAGKIVREPFLAETLAYGFIADEDADQGEVFRQKDNFYLTELVAAVFEDFPESFDDGIPANLDVEGVQLSNLDERDYSVRQIGVARDVDGDGVFDEDTADIIEPITRITVPSPNDDTRILFAAGDLDGVADLPGRSLGDAPSVDRFLLTPGLVPEIEGTYDALNVPDPDDPAYSATTRAFVRRETWTELGADLDVSDVTDRGVFVINPTGPVIDPDIRATDPLNRVIVDGADSRLLHADFGLKNMGDRHISSISATIGTIDFRLSREENGALAVDPIARAQTVASSNDGRRASTLITSDFFSTAAGGGNPNTDEGHPGFMVLQNAGDVYDDVVSDAPRRIEGGTEQPMGGGPADLRYGQVRLATAFRTEYPTARTGHPGGLLGYAAGWVEQETGGGSEIALVPLERAGAGPNLRFSAADLDTNTIASRLSFDGGKIAFGGNGTSAFVDDLTYGLLSDGSGTRMAIVSAETVGRELSGQFVSSAGDAVPVPVRDRDGTSGKSYKHLQWGFFFGDAVTDENNRQHVHLGTYAAGSPIPENVLRSARGVATYTGHAAGNVYDGGKVYSSLGTFREKFDFDRRKGNTTLDFDKRRYKGSSSLDVDTGVYGSKVVSGNRAGALDGRFVGGVSGRKGKPNALVGGFEITDGSGDPAKAYRATGTFGGERRRR